MPRALTLVEGYVPHESDPQLDDLAHEDSHEESGDESLEEEDNVREPRGRWVGDGDGGREDDEEDGHDDPGNGEEECECRVVRPR